jgi:hypothetical protein
MCVLIHFVGSYLTEATSRHLACKFCRNLSKLKTSCMPSKSVLTIYVFTPWGVWSAWRNFRITLYPSYEVILHYSCSMIHAPAVFVSSHRALAPTEAYLNSCNYRINGARGSVEVKALCYTPEGHGFDIWWGNFLNFPNPSGRTRPWGLLSL